MGYWGQLPFPPLLPWGIGKFFCRKSWSPPPSSSSLFYSCLSIRDHFDEVLPFLCNCILTPLGKSCNSICPFEFLSDSSLLTIPNIISFSRLSPSSLVYILQVLFYNCIEEFAVFSSFKQDTLIGPTWLSMGCRDDVSNTWHPKGFNFSSICSIDRPGFTCI